MSKGDDQLDDWFKWAIRGDFKKIKEHTYTYSRKMAKNDMTALMYASIYGYVEIVRHLATVETGIRNDYGFTALMLSVLRDDVEPFQMTPDNLLENTAAAIDRKYDYATRKRHRLDIMNELIDSEGEIRDFKGRTVLMLAVEHNNRDAVEFLLNRRAELTEDHGWNKFMHAIIRQDMVAFDNLYSVYGTKRNLARQTPLMQAALMGNQYMVKRLMTSGTKRHDIRGLTALIIAAKSNEPGIVSMLVEREAQLTDKTGATALMYAASRGLAEVARILQSAEEGMQDSYGWSALMYACLANNVEITMLLQKAECHLTDRSRISTLMYAAVLNRVEVFNILLEELVLKADIDGTTALMYAIVFNRLEIAQKLIDFESKLVDSNGLTALHHAVIQNHMEMVNLLVKSEYSMKDAKGRTALYSAIKLGHLGLAKILVPFEKDGPLPDGWTRCMVCAIADMPEYFPTHSAEMQSFNPNGDTALMLATEHSTLETIAALVQYEVGLRNKKTGRTALMYAVFHGRDKVIPLLFSHEKMAQDKGGLSATMISVCTNQISILKILLDPSLNNGSAGKPFEAGLADIYGQTALMKAVLLGNHEAVRLLLPFESGIKDFNGYAAIFYAQVQGFPNIIALLIPTEGAITDKAGNTYSTYKCGDNLGMTDPLAAMNVEYTEREGCERLRQLSAIKEESIDTGKTTLFEDTTNLAAYTSRKTVEPGEDDPMSIVRIGLSIDASSRIEVQRDTPEVSNLQLPDAFTGDKRHAFGLGSNNEKDDSAGSTPRIMHELENKYCAKSSSLLLTDSPHILTNMSRITTPRTNIIQAFSNIIKDANEGPDASGKVPSITELEDGKRAPETLPKDANGEASQVRSRTTASGDGLGQKLNTSPKDSGIGITDKMGALPQIPIVDAPPNIPYVLIRENNVIYRVPVHSTGGPLVSGPTASQQRVMEYVPPDFQKIHTDCDFPPFPTIENSPYQYLDTFPAPQMGVFPMPLPPPPPLLEEAISMCQISCISTEKDARSTIRVFARPCKHIFGVPVELCSDGYLQIDTCPVCFSIIEDVILEGEP